MKRVGVDGNRTRYQSGAYDSMQEKRTVRQYEWHRDNKSITVSGIVYAWDFFCAKYFCSVACMTK